MCYWLVRVRKQLALYSAWLRHAEFRSSNNAISIVVFVFMQFVRFPVLLATYVVEIPTLLDQHPMGGFNACALRDSRGLFLESYSAYLRRMRISIATALLVIVTITGQFYFLGYSIWIAGQPTRVEAYTSIVTINPTWDQTAIGTMPLDDLCDSGEEAYSCLSDTATTLRTGQVITCPGSATRYSSFMQFNLAAANIPTGATITKVELKVNVTRMFQATSINIVRANNNVKDLSCNDGAMVGDGALMGVPRPSWTTLGSKTVDLLSTAVSDVQSRLNGTYGIGITNYNSSSFGEISSVNAASNKPELIVTYTVAPQAPTAATPNHGAITTSAITWNWIDNATADTSNLVKNGATTMCTTGAAAGTGTTVSCTESGLSPNTSYTRTPNVIDADGNTSGPAMTAYTAAVLPNIASPQTESMWYSNNTFSFTNTAGFGAGGVQYYRYVWDTNTTHAFSGSESTWSDAHANCPSSACTTANATLSQTATVDGQNWFLHVQSFNGDDVANGTGTSYGPYWFDGTAPTISAVSVVTTTTTASVSWTTGSAATSQVDYGLSSGYGTSTTLDNAAVISHTISLTGLTAGTTYHYRVRSIDQVANESSSSDATFTTLAETIAPAPAPSTTPTITLPPTSTVTTPTISNTAELTTTADTTPTIAGTGPANSTIFLVVDRKLVRTVLVGADGKYFVDLKSALSLGTHTVVVRAKTVSGQVSDESAPLSITVTQGGMGTTVLWRNITDGIKPSITFGAVAPVNATVKILIDATVVKTIDTTSSTPPAFGFITTITPPSSLSAGKHTISLVTVNSSGRPSIPTGVTIFSKTVISKTTSVVLRYGQPTTYTVQAGDSLWKIAEKLLGNGAEFTKLIKANQDAHLSLQSQPHLLRAGWTISLPAS